MSTALIIGGSRGIGRALVEELLARHWHTMTTARDRRALEDMAERQKDRVEVFELEMTDQAAINRLRRQLEARSLELLFVSAGIFGPVDQSFTDLADETFDEIMHVNALAPLRIVEAFVDLVPEDGTVAVMSTVVASGGEDSGSNFEPYRMSKGALNLGFRSIAARLSDGGRTYLAISPGWVQTDMGGKDAPLTAQESAQGILDALDARKGTKEVSFIDHENNLLPW